MGAVAWGVLGMQMPTLGHARGGRCCQVLGGTHGTYILNAAFLSLAEVPNCQSSYLRGGIFPSSHDGECTPGPLPLTGIPTVSCPIPPLRQADPPLKAGRAVRHPKKHL